MTVVNDLLARAAEASPEAIVFTADGGREAKTYAELVEDARGIGHALVECGVERGDRVGVALEGGYELLVTLYGILAAGAVYVPLGCATSLDRLVGIAEDAELVAVVDGRTGHRRELGALQPRVRHGARGRALFEDGAAAALAWAEIERSGVDPPGRRSRESDLAYIFYTSGSTGAPKGVAHEHRSACVFARWARDTLIADAADRVAAASAITFDISLLELVAPVARGATIVEIPRRVAVFPGAFAQAVADARPTVLQLVPQLWRYLFDSPSALACMRVGVVTGEHMAAADWSVLRAVAPRARLVNVYGSTELNDCVCFELPAQWPQSAGEVPIGLPVSGVSVDLMRPDGSPCAEGEVGELIVSSPMLMRGYWKLGDQTERRMRVGVDGTPAFRTGDLARRGVDGMIELTGREDRSVKLGGEWVHLGEVEAVVAQHPVVVEAIAAVVDAGQHSLVHVTAVASEEIDPVEIQRHCATRLPRAARPHRVELVSALPRNDRGKVERLVALPPPQSPTRRCQAD